MIDPAYIELAERLNPKIPNAPDEIVVACMVMTLRRHWGNRPQAIYDEWDRELTAALRVIRQRSTLAN